MTSISLSPFSTSLLRHFLHLSHAIFSISLTPCSASLFRHFLHLSCAIFIISLTPFSEQSEQFQPASSGRAGGITASRCRVQGEPQHAAPDMYCPLGGRGFCKENNIETTAWVKFLHTLK
jgi:hypothetical protein